MEGMQADSHGRDLASLRDDLKSRDPESLAGHTGVRLGEDEEGERLFLVTYWDRELKISFPDFTVTDTETCSVADERAETVLIHYFHTADGADRGSGWVSLAELPDGAFYRKAYQGYSGDHLALAIQNDLESLKRASVILGGKPEVYGDLSFSFYVLPHIDLLAVYWRGDDEFPPSAQVLFPDSASHYLPTDIYAYLGKLLVERILETRDGDGTIEK